MTLINYTTKKQKHIVVEITFLWAFYKANIVAPDNKLVEQYLEGKLYMIGPLTIQITRVRWRFNHDSN